MALSPADSVEYPACSLDVPFVFIYSLVIFGVDDCVFSLCEWDAAESVAVADAAVQKCKPNERLYKPVRNVKIYPDGFLPPSDEIRSTKFEIRNKFELPKIQMTKTKSF